MQLKLDNWVIARLSEPFPTDEVRFRDGGRGGSVFAYIDARQVADRLNYVVGAENWYDSYTQISSPETVVQAIDPEGKHLNKTKYNEDYHKVVYTNSHAGILCSLTILGVTKSDVGSPSNAEQLKGAVSDAFKRAAVKFGVGSYLYDLKGLTKQDQELPDFAIPIERPSPDGVIKELIEQVKNPTPEVQEAIDALMVMGSYDPYAPLIVKRHAYEILRKFVDTNEA